jgi:hypothetical protein
MKHRSIRWQQHQKTTECHHLNKSTYKTDLTKGMSGSRQMRVREGGGGR